VYADYLLATGGTDISTVHCMVVCLRVTPVDTADRRLLLLLLLLLLPEHSVQLQAAPPPSYVPRSRQMHGRTAAARLDFTHRRHRSLARRYRSTRRSGWSRTGVRVYACRSVGRRR